MTAWPEPKTEQQVALHNARVAISRAEDEIRLYKTAFGTKKVPDGAYDALNHASVRLIEAAGIIRTLFDAQAERDAKKEVRNATL